MKSEFAGYDAVDFATGTVRGIRTFDVDRLGRLHSVSYSENIWRPGDNEAPVHQPTRTARMPMTAWGPDEAEIDRRRELDQTDPLPEHRAGDPDCSCGFYAYHDGSIYPNGQVTGIIDGWGNTTVGTKGFRCEKARIVALALVEDKANVTIESKAEDKPVRSLATFIPLMVCTGSLIVQICVAVARGGNSWIAAAVGAGIVGVAAGAHLLTMHYKRESQETRKTYTSMTVSFTTSTRKTKPAPERLELVRRNYPDAKVFDSVKAMAAEFPPDKGPEPSLPSPADADFWTRES